MPARCFTTGTDDPGTSPVSTLIVPQDTTASFCNRDMLMKRPGKAIEIKDDLQQLLHELGFTREGHAGGFLCYRQDFSDGTCIQLQARYGERDDDEWECEFRLEMIISGAGAIKVRIQPFSSDDEYLSESEVTEKLPTLIAELGLLRQLLHLPSALIARHLTSWR